jgi:hypothetical protein
MRFDPDSQIQEIPEWPQDEIDKHYKQHMGGSFDYIGVTLPKLKRR